ncbi:uridine kinase [Planoprotostelium fungivorum]|uniref:Uridine-cytidine kinase n=1 Tax=Planoprotostelium fungivorum TaxID=1890364 RepID=A0A2P6MYE9_9EUKA|nr:uridine kinase [Planoprotostelium fungivorum]
MSLFFYRYIFLDSHVEFNDTFYNFGEESSGAENIMDVRSTDITKRANIGLSVSLPNVNIIPWRQEHLESKHEPFIIGVAGGTASGKTSVCDIIVKELGIDQSRVAIISQDCFYKPLTPEQIQNVKKYDFDHPDAFDWDLIEETLRDLHDGKAIKVPIYDYVTHSRKTESTNLYAIDIILFEGILVFYQQRIMKYMHLKIFVDTDADIRLARRILRDIKHRGRDLDGVLQQYQTFVKPSFDEYVLPTKKNADVIVPRGADNVVAIDLLVQHIKLKLLAISGRKLKLSGNKEKKDKQQQSRKIEDSTREI